MLRALFTSDFFKSEAVHFAKVKSPAEMVAGTLRLAGEHREIKPGLFLMSQETKYMGMELMNPPTVEGWHTGREWIDGGSLVERINFAAGLLGNTKLPGVKSVVARLMSWNKVLSPEELVDGCLDLIGPLKLADSTRKQLISLAQKGGQLRHCTEAERADFSRRTSKMLQMIAATAEFQFA
jgi:hypothetical protein